ncbi:hypothetical protein AVEN_30884-1 [Araneus ventricosus]|uniref:Uncharacterized protein n=1 Tax=Araneus ventricosus TaxID=182803 RepID=A0A4Y1ZVD5_ARAVE|nr:hypothetical protein AVEN_30884-1 [Araneus ventricosus]
MKSPLGHLFRRRKKSCWKTTFLKVESAHHPMLNNNPRLSIQNFTAFGNSSQNIIPNLGSRKFSNSLDARSTGTLAKKLQIFSNDILELFEKHKKMLMDTQSIVIQPSDKKV